MATNSRPDPVPATIPNDEDDEFDPTAGGRKPPKATKTHPVKNQGGKDTRGQGTNTPEDGPPEQDNSDAFQEPGNQGGKESMGQGRLSSGERPKLGARVDPWLKRTLKIAAALEGRTEEALVEQALTAYFWQHHPQLAAAQQEDAQNRVAAPQPGRPRTTRKTAPTPLISQSR